MSLDKKLTRFPDGIPLILPYGSKGQPVPGSGLNRYMKGWEKRTLAETLSADYQGDLRTLRCNVAIRQGGGVTAFVSFDFDTEDSGVWREFFLANPRLRKTFVTKGARGFNVWFKIKGDYPASKKEIDVRGEKVEWRGGGYVLIHGRHPSGVDYTVLNDQPVVELEWSELVCPSPEWKNWPRLQEKEEKEKAQSNFPVRLLSAWQAKKRRDYVDRAYEVLSWNEDYSKAHVECKNKEAHSTDTGDGQTVIFTGADARGIPSYYCSHAHCREENPESHSSFNKDETALLLAGFMGCETFVLHSQNERLDETLKDLYGHMATLGCFYRQSERMPYGILYWRLGEKEPIQLVPETLASCLGREKILFSKVNAKGRLVECLANGAQADVILGSSYAGQLPIVKAVNLKPLLVKTGQGATLCGEQYVPELETIILGKRDALPEVGFEEGLALINSLLDFWIWKDPSDRARAWAELLTPAMLQGGFLKRPVPAMLITADEMHAGKTLWHSCVSWAYGYEPDPHAHTRASIGSLEEQLQHSLSKGVPFFFIDELDGTIKNTFVNAFITGGDEITVRTAYNRFVTVSTDKLIIQLAGVKGFVIDPQLASRTIPIRIVKPAETDGYHWVWPDGTLLKTWMREASPKLLASIYAVISKWAAVGYPEETADSRFPSWSMPINGILARVLDVPRATEGLEDIQGEVSSAASMWLPELFLILEEEGLVWSGEGHALLLSAANIQGICSDQGIGVPGSRAELRDEALVNNQIRLIHKIIAGLPRDKETNGRDPIYRTGEHFIIQFPYRNPRNGKMAKHYVTGRSSRVPASIEKYIRTQSVENDD